MNTKSIAAIAVAGILAATIGFSAAFAGGDRHGGHGGYGPSMFRGGGHDFGLHMLNRMADKLDLAPEQREQIEEIVQTAKPKLKELGQSMHELRFQLMEISPNDPAYSTVVAEVSQASADLARDMVLLTSDVRVRVYSVLTLEQQAKAAEMKAGMREKMREHHEKRLEQLDSQD